MKIFMWIVSCLLVVGCDRSEQDWEAAVQSQSISGYSEFLNKYPESSFRKDALRLRLEAVLRTALHDSYAGNASSEPTLTIEQISGLHYGRDSEATLTDSMRLRALTLLASAIQQAPTDSLSISSIQPDETPPIDLAKSSMSMTGTFESSAARCIANFEETLMAPRESKLVARMSGCVVFPFAFPGVSSQGVDRLNVKSFLTFERIDGKQVATARQQDQSFYFRFSPNQPAEIEFLIPTGAGTLYEFSGQIDGFVDGWVIDGAPEDPLVFALVLGNGLTYIAGSGVVTKNGEPQNLASTRRSPSVGSE